MICTVEMLSGVSSAVPRREVVRLENQRDQIVVGGRAQRTAIAVRHVGFHVGQEVPDGLCVKPSQNLSPLSDRLPCGTSAWQFEHDWLKVAVARDAWISV